jgi:cytochrome P450
MSAAALPPGPRLPPLAQTLGFLLGGARFLDACRRRYGDLVSFSTVFDSSFVMVFDPDLVRRIFQARPDHLRAGQANALLGPLLGERSVLVLDGAEHLRQRRLMLPPFHGSRMRAFESAVVEAADREIDSWPVGRPFGLVPSMQALTLDVIMQAVFGVEPGARREELRRRIRAMLAPMSRPAALLALSFSGGRLGDRGARRRFEEQRRRVDALIHAEIARRRAAADLEERDDVLSALLLARDEDGSPMSDGEVRDQLVTLLVAGHETTATGLTWAFDLLLHDEPVLARLRESLAAGGDDGYLDAVVKEALRLRPVVPGIGRVVNDEPYELGGYRIPPGVELNPSISVIHRRPDRYPQPGRFRPERFLGDDAPDTYTWLPFGGGTRRCLGASFATFEMRVVIRRVLERAELRAAAPRPERVQRRGITLVPRRGVRVRQARAPSPAPTASARPVSAPA